MGIRLKMLNACFDIEARSTFRIQTIYSEVHQYRTSDLPFSLSKSASSHWDVFELRNGVLISREVLVRRMSTHTHVFSAALFVAAAFWCCGAKAQVLVHFDLPVQSLARSLTAIGAATNTSIGFSASQVAGLIAPSLKADLTVDGALTNVLTGTKLRPQHLDDHTIVIATRESSMSGSAETRVALVKASLPAEAADQIMTPQAELGDDSRDSASSSNPRTNELDDIVVTGTKISGSQPSSRVLSYSRADIEQQGFGNIQDFIQSLPDNFGGGASQNSVSGVTGDGNASNIVNATGVNLRGLGNDATLVLIDGQRMAPGNWQGNFVDISMLPLSAIDRVEVVPDGASALYGSDAVGGVVNFILRKNLDGVETSVRYGSVTEGSRDDIEFSQAFGGDWAGGSGLVAYDFDRTSALPADDRKYVALTTQLPFTLLPTAQRQSVLFTGQQDVTPGVRAFGDALSSHRDVQSELTGEFTYPSSQQQNSKIDTYDVTAGIDADLTNKLKFELTSNFGTSRTQYQIADLTQGGAVYNSDRFVTDLYSFDAKLDGRLAELPAGTARFAVGGQFRRETFSYVDVTFSEFNFEASRNIGAAFVEVHLPIVGSFDASAGTGGSVELQLAGRYEHYSEFGSTCNPKIGLVWHALSTLSLRANYSTSFVAPLLADLNPKPSDVEADAGADYGPGDPNVIYFAGGNPNLQPQKSKNWTLGVDFKSNSRPLWQGHLDYYHISYTDRISNATAVTSFYSVFQNESILGPSIVQRNPSPAYVQQLEASPIFVNYDVTNLADIGAVIDDQKQNLSSLITDGIDFGASLRPPSALWQTEFGIDGNYILQYDTRFSPTAPITSFLNTAYNPIDLKLRARSTVERGPFSLGLFANYVSSYRNPVSVGFVPIASWATIDATASYAFHFISQNKPSILRVGVTNLMDRPPPYVGNARNGVNFDGANANALGRFVYVQLLTRW